MISIILIECFVLSYISNYILGNVPGSKKKKLTLQWDFLGGKFLERIFKPNHFDSIFSVQVISSKLG
jgi:hypothetical protein